MKPILEIRVTKCMKPTIRLRVTHHEKPKGRLRVKLQYETQIEEYESK